MVWNTRLRGTEVVERIVILVAMPFGQLSPRKSESRACYLNDRCSRQAIQ
jgi:hypothetical protein